MFRYICCCLSAVFYLSCSVPPPPAPYGPVPTASQLSWQEMEMYCIVHFGPDTYTDKEWGYGDESPALFDPSSFSAEQIVETVKAGGFKGVILVAKHHDGFCLWPTATTAHNISASPWKEGKGDMVKEFQVACENNGIRLGLYCSPWDRNNAAYGTPAYVSLYREQLRELYSRYGPLFISWHDGANGGDGYYGGARESRSIDRTSYYGWDSTFKITRSMQPSAVIFGDIGPDVRWVGNEEGAAGETNWATYTPVAPEEGKAPANGFSKYWLATEGTQNGRSWMPAECDVPLRPGWFYHEAQDDQVKSPGALLELYYKSVGRGAALDLGLAPARRGLLHDNDVLALKQFGDILRQTFAVNLAAKGKFSASNIRGNSSSYGTAGLVDNDRYTYWGTDDSVRAAELLLDLPAATTFNVIRLRENIKLGQRITSFRIAIMKDGQWEEICSATTVAGNRLVRLPERVSTEKIRLDIQSMASIALSDFALFLEPLLPATPAILRDKEDSVRIFSEDTAAIHYTTDGSDPGLHSPLYKQAFSFPEGGTIKARAFREDGQSGSVATKEFGLSAADWLASSPSSDPDAIRKAIDQDPVTFFSLDSLKGFDAGLQLDLRRPYMLAAITYLPRQDRNKEGIIDQYLLMVSTDGSRWKEAARGEFANISANPLEQVIRLPEKTKARFIKLIPRHLVAGSRPVIAELGVRLR